MAIAFDKQIQYLMMPTASVAIHHVFGVSFLLSVEQPHLQMSRLPLLLKLNNCLPSTFLPPWLIGGSAHFQQHQGTDHDWCCFHQSFRAMVRCGVHISAPTVHRNIPPQVLFAQPQWSCNEQESQMMHLHDWYLLDSHITLLCFLTLFSRTCCLEKKNENFCCLILHP